MSLKIFKLILQVSTFILLSDSKLDVTDSRFDIVAVFDESLSTRDYKGFIKDILGEWRETNVIMVVLGIRPVIDKFSNIGLEQEQTRFGIAFCGFADDAWVFRLDQSTSKERVKNTFNYQKEKLYRDNWRKCFKVARNLFEPHKGDRPDAANVVIVFTDGAEGGYDSEGGEDFKDEVKDLVQLKNVTIYALYWNWAKENAEKAGVNFDSVNRQNLLKMTHQKPENIINVDEDGDKIIEKLRNTYGVGTNNFTDCIIGYIAYTCGLVDGICKRAEVPYTKINPHPRGEQCPVPYPSINYIPCDKSDCDCLKPEFFTQPECPTKNCNKNLLVNITRIGPTTTECNQTYTWSPCTFNCPSDETEPKLIIILVVSVCLMVLVLTVLGVLIYRRRQRIAKRGFDSTTLTLGSRTPSTSKTILDSQAKVAVVESTKSVSESRSEKSKSKSIRKSIYGKSGLQLMSGSRQNLRTKIVDKKTASEMKNMSHQSSNSAVKIGSLQTKIVSHQSRGSKVNKLP